MPGFRVAVKSLGLQAYTETYQAMQAFNASRGAETVDEIWCLQHHPVFTLGLNGKRHHILQASDIPVVETDRGGQVTYHGPGQLVVYVLVDLQRGQIGVRQLVSMLENAVIALLNTYGLHACAKKTAPGVYLQEAKIASVGLRIKRHCSYHGLSLNVDLDLTPFQYINPCGYEHLRMTRLCDWLPDLSLHQVERDLVSILSAQLDASVA